MLNDIQTISPELGADALLHEYRNGNITDLKVDGIRMDDYPDFCDSYFSEGILLLGDGHWRELTENELSILTDILGDVVHEKAHNQIH